MFGLSGAFETVFARLQVGKGFDNEIAPRCRSSNKCALLLDRLILIFLRTVVTPFPLATCHSEAAGRLNCRVILYIPYIFRIVSCNAMNLETDVTVRNDISVICHSAIYVFPPAAVSDKFCELSWSVPTWNFRIQLLLKFVN